MTTIDADKLNADAQLERRHLQQTIEALRFELEAERQNKQAEMQQIRAEKSLRGSF